LARSRRFANLSNPSTRRAYENAVRDFMRFTGIARPEEFLTVTRAHIIAWRDVLRAPADHPPSVDPRHRAFGQLTGATRAPSGRGETSSPR
jgi:hypothetical protein